MSDDMMRVAVDLDDVTVDFFAGVIHSMNIEFGASIEKELCVSWDDNPVKLFDWKSYGYKSWWDWMSRRDWLWATFQAVPGAIGGINRLRQDGHYVEALTSKPEWAEPQVWRWLGRWRPPFNQVTLVDLNRTKDTKAMYSTSDILIDDKPQNIEEWVASETDRVGIIFDQPWNQKVRTQPDVFRARDWREVVALVKFLEVGEP